MQITRIWLSLIVSCLNSAHDHAYFEKQIDKVGNGSAPLDCAGPVNLKKNVCSIEDR